MKAFHVDNVQNRITVIYNYIKACDEHIDKDDYVVILGNTCGKTHDRIKEEYDHIAKLITKPPLYVASSYDMLFVENESFDANKWHLVSWYQSQYISASFQLANYNKYVITTGGFRPIWKDWEQARSDMEQAFVSWIRGKSWHEEYDGRFGYVISGDFTGPGIQRTFPHSATLWGRDQSTICHIEQREHNIIRIR